MNFKLTKKILNKQYKLCQSDNWVTNGVFAIKKDSIVGEIPQIIESIQEDTILKITGAIEKEKEFFKTDYLRNNYGKKYYRIFEDRYKNKVFIDEDYVKSFNIDRLFGKEAYSPMWIVPEKLLIMPSKLLED